MNIDANNTLLDHSTYIDTGWAQEPCWILAVYITNKEEQTIKGLRHFDSAQTTLGEISTVKALIDFINTDAQCRVLRDHYDLLAPADIVQACVGFDYATAKANLVDMQDPTAEIFSFAKLTRHMLEEDGLLPMVFLVVDERSAVAGDDRDLQAS